MNHLSLLRVNKLPGTYRILHHSEFGPLDCQMRFLWEVLHSEPRTPLTECAARWRQSTSTALTPRVLSRDEYPSFTTRVLHLIFPNDMYPMHRKNRQWTFS